MTVAFDPHAQPPNAALAAPIGIIARLFFGVADHSKRFL